MMASSSSCSEVGRIPPQHQVFINFRGKQLRRGFLSFLIPALLSEKINVFVDETELRSRDLQHLFKRIEESRVALVIFSTWYTESKWCLDELVKINQRRIEGKLKVIPIFYKVTVDEVEKIEGIFGINFRETKRNHRGELDRIKNWEEALETIPKRLGLTSSKYRTEYDLVNAIVVEVKRLLDHIPKDELTTAITNRYKNEKQAPKQTKNRVTVHNSQAPNKVSNFSIPKIRKVLIQRSSDMSKSEDEENVPLESERLNLNRKKRKKDSEEILVLEDKWKAEDCAQSIGQPIRFTGQEEKQRYHYEKFEFDGKQYGLEDSVLIIPEVPNRKLYVAIIKDIYKQGKENYVYVEVQWFYRPEDAEKKDGGNWESKDPRVLFYSFHRDEVFAESVKNKCDVHFVPGNKQIPKRREHPGFVVQNVYDFVSKKLWKLTDDDFHEKQKA